MSTPNHRFIELGDQALGECIGERDASGHAQWMVGDALVRVVPQFA
ncbi:hypothetical protein P3W53_06200 [Pseudomonas denitrificans (nom. rej.)]|nr:hypothetical protein [Pseudomonas denitrificans (nom. rej.)]